MRAARAADQGPTQRVAARGPRRPGASAGGTPAVPAPPAARRQIAKDPGPPRRDQVARGPRELRPTGSRRHCSVVVVLAGQAC